MVTVALRVSALSFLSQLTVSEVSPSVPVAGVTLHHAADDCALQSTLQVTVILDEDGWAPNVIDDLRGVWQLLQPG